MPKTYTADIPRAVVMQIQCDKLNEMRRSIRRHIADIKNKEDVSYYILTNYNEEQLQDIIDFIESFTPLCNSIQAGIKEE